MSTEFRVWVIFWMSTSVISYDSPGQCGCLVSTLGIDKSPTTYQILPHTLHCNPGFGDDAPS